uniref:WW domain-containing protein n=1 Tax=Mesocestoides corti TaxID=53468 RepID=A0A5K3F9L4_MESCO
MESTDIPANDGCPTERQTTQLEPVDSRTQRLTSNTGSAASNDVSTASPGPSTFAHQNLTPPSKPISLLPPVPATTVKSGAAAAAASSSSVPPPKPPRASSKSTVTKEERPTENYNAYEIDDQLCAKPLRQSVPQMRHSKGWVIKKDVDGQNYYTHPHSSDQCGLENQLLPVVINRKIRPCIFHSILMCCGCLPPFTRCTKTT